MAAGELTLNRQVQVHPSDKHNTTFSTSLNNSFTTPVNVWGCGGGGGGTHMEALQEA